MSGHSTEIISSNTGGINDQFGIKLQRGFGIFVIIHDPLTPPSFESENIYDDVTIVDNANALLSIHKTIINHILSKKRYKKMFVKESTLKNCLKIISLKYTSIIELPKTNLFDFISNIAGISDIFIGASFVSLFEITEIIIEIFYILFQNKKIKNEITIRESLNSRQMSEPTNHMNLTEEEI